MDNFILLGGATGIVMTAMVVARLGFEMLSLTGGTLSLILISIIIWARGNNQKI